jgi:CubicO group peptidase (beta-lactamase class C family)
MRLGILAGAMASGVVFAGACGGRSVPSGVAGPRSPIATRIDSAFASEETAGFSGAVLVAEAGRIVLRRGYGLAERENRRCFTPGTGFDIGSITKQFTAAAVLRLAGLGRLRTDDTLGMYLAGLPGSTARVTLHQLLTHTAGLPQYSGDDYEVVPRDSLIAWLRRTPLDRPPGTGFAYSNPGYSVLATVVEIVSGRSYEQFLRSEFFAPLGLRRTGYVLPRWNRHELAVGYTGKGGRFGTPLDSAWAPDGPGWHLRGNGGLLSTVDDLYAWHAALRSHRVLSPPATRQLFTPYVRRGEAGDTYYGYGWQIRRDSAGTVINHTGGNGVFFADVRWFVEQNVVAIVANNAFSAEQVRRLLGALRAAVVR